MWYAEWSLPGCCRVFVCLGAELAILKDKGLVLGQCDFATGFSTGGEVVCVYGLCMPHTPWLAWLGVPGIKSKYGARKKGKHRSSETIRIYDTPPQNCETLMPNSRNPKQVLKIKSTDSCLNSGSKTWQRN